MSVLKLVLLFSLNLVSVGASAQEQPIINEMAAEICDDTGKIYKVCQDQQAIYDGKHQDALTENKMLIIVFGADWCPWCRSLNKLFNEENFAGSIHDNMLFQEIGIYNGREKVESGINILAHLASSNSLDVNNFKAVPLIVVMNPTNDKAVFIETGSLEKNTATSQGHDPQKVLDSINSARSSLLN